MNPKWILGIVIGFLILRYAYQIKNFSGNWDWAEKVFGAGGTHTAIKLVGILAIIFSVMAMTGGIRSFLVGTIGRFFPLSQ
ncbi:hypothetical protein AUJ78_00730 [Candidatus Peregrinibacteria bacterium CG1_02_41_10]|nr:MAG: hypothetical protein AUJ78_00730 [Candidatus Peregrinibacteria bacterium CG1_02_41_10]